VSGRLGRLRYLAAVCLRHGVGYAAERVGWGTLATRMGTRGLSGPTRLRALLEDLGGSFVKFGQILACQPDLMPPGYSAQLLDLLDRVAPVPTAAILETIAAELGPAAARLEELDPVPLATASIAQVHVARVDGQRVAVKVQRPGIEEEFGADVRMTRLMVRTVKALHLRWLYWIEEPASEFISWTEEELDFRREARHMMRLQRQAAGRSSVRVPTVVKDLTTRRVLVAEYLDGIPLASYLRGAAPPDDFDAATFGRRLILNFAFDAFHHGVFHADLHPANLLILPGNVVGYVDFGITGSISRYARTWLGTMTLALVRRDLDDMHRAFMRLVVPRPDASPAGLRAGLDRLAEEWYVGPGQTRLRVPVARMMMDMLAGSRQNAMLPEREVVKYIRSVMTLDGVVHRFAPNLDLGSELERACTATLVAEADGQLLVDLWAGGLRAAEMARTVSTSVIGRLVSAGLGARPRLTALQLAATVFVCAVCLPWAPPAGRAGLNLVSAEVAVGIVALFALVFEVVRTNE
jgi:ubiquinone biosynthesis protein